MKVQCEGQLPEGRTMGTCLLCFRDAYRSDTVSGIRHAATPKALVERRKANAAAR
jgi:hypothetical protein